MALVTCLFTFECYFQFLTFQIPKQTEAFVTRHSAFQGAETGMPSGMYLFLQTPPFSCCVLPFLPHLQK